MNRPLNKSVPVQFLDIAVGSKWDRNELARVWQYASFHALARGVFTPADDNKIVLFVTEDKQESSTQYADTLQGTKLHWEGEGGHRTDDRIANAEVNGNEIHIFYRQRHHSSFQYLGQAHVKSVQLQTQKPSEFVFRIG